MEIKKYETEGKKEEMKKELTEDWEKNMTWKWRRKWETEKERISNKNEWQEEMNTQEVEGREVKKYEWGWWRRREECGGK